MAVGQPHLNSGPQAAHGGFGRCGSVPLGHRTPVSISLKLLGPLVSRPGFLHLHAGGQSLPLTIIMNIIMSTMNIIKILYPTTVHVHTRRAWTAS